MKLAFYRYSIGWCKSNLDKCSNQWKRLYGIKISVGRTAEEDTSLVECGTVPEYAAPVLRADVEPDPIYKTVTCNKMLFGDWIFFEQTREEVPLQLSEIYIRSVDSSNGK